MRSLFDFWTVDLISNVLWGKNVDDDGRPISKNDGQSSSGSKSRSNSASRRTSGSKKKMTLSGQFRQQLNALMIKLNNAKPHYIRCK